MSIGLVKNSPYKIFMDRVLIKLSENGQTYKTMEEWQVKEPDCKPLTNTGNPLTLEKLISLFMIVCSGILLALTVMIFELFSKCFTQNEVQLDNKDLLKFKKILEEIQNDLPRNKRPSAILLSQLRESSRRIEDKQNN